MGVLVDANILLDILTADPIWLPWSTFELQKARLAGQIVINPIICAEIAPAFDFDWIKLERWLRPSFLTLEALPFEASVVAAQAHAIYRKRGGKKDTPLPDFYIGAHAETAGHSRLTRDSSRYQTYFPAVQLISPTMP
jgi:predicted nucleic acid-binding protein